MAYIGNTPILQTTEFREEHLVEGSPQSLFHTQGYTVGYLTCFRNGVRLAFEDYTADDGSSVTLNVPAQVGDMVVFEYRNDVVPVQDNSINVTKLNLQPNDIPYAVVNVASAEIGLEKINITANSIPVSSIDLTANSIPVAMVDMSGINLDAGAKADVFYENSNVLTESYTISENKNAITAGPITVADGVVVTVPANSVWTVV